MADMPVRRITEAHYEKTHYSLMQSLHGIQIRGSTNEYAECDLGTWQIVACM